VEYTATVLAMGKNLLFVTFLHGSLRLCLRSVQLIAISVISESIHNR